MTHPKILPKVSCQVDYDAVPIPRTVLLSIVSIQVLVVTQFHLRLPVFPVAIVAFEDTTRFRLLFILL
jgi:hypothetical protein